LKIELDWIDSRVKGRPYGIDLLIPNKMEDKQGDLAEAELQSRIPDGHRKFVNSLLERHGIDTSDLWSGEYDKRTADSMREAGAAKLLDVAFQHPIKLFVNALGVPPKSIMERARSKGILVGALTGAKEHAIKHAERGSIYLSLPAPRRVAIAARFRRWYSSPRSCRPSSLTKTSMF